MPQRIATYVCAASIIVIAITSALAESDFEGVWAHDPAWCGNSSDQTDQIPITITSDEIQGLENICKIVARSKAGDAVKLDLDCAGEGVQYRSSTILLTVGGYLVHFDTSNNSVRVFTRCE